MLEIQDRYEAPRGCGYRKPGGLYLMSGGELADCGLMPIPLDVCPCCGQGIKPSRGWTWIEPAKILAGSWARLAVEKAALDPASAEIEHFSCGPGHVCDRCPNAPQNVPERAGLLWIGEKFYKTPQAFMDEARKMGVSRRIKFVPKDFTLGETWGWFAHRKAIPVTVPKKEADEEGRLFETVYTPGVIGVFRPTHLEYVVKEDDKEDKLARMAEREISLVRVHKAEEVPS
ncbi:hypothetical protein CMI37_03075 [Candidatus Pacearchaeota archaeon]|nr:hypothetical protein [Candidatus Pacearchaeota archaeon]